MRLSIYINTHPPDKDLFPLRPHPPIPTPRRTFPKCISMAEAKYYSNMSTEKYIRTDNNNNGSNNYNNVSNETKYRNDPKYWRRLLWVYTVCHSSSTIWNTSAGTRTCLFQILEIYGKKLRCPNT